MFILSKVDVLGIPASLNFFGNYKKTSGFGGLLSLIFFAFVVWTIYNSSHDLINRTNPKITTSKINHEEPRLINISNKAFPVAFVVQSSPTYQAVGFYDQTVYTLEVYHRMIERIKQQDGSVKKVLTQTRLYTERCTKEHFGDYASSFQSFTFLGSYCVYQNQTNITKLRIQGTSSSAVYESVIAKVIKCNNQTSNGTCKTEAEINKWLGGGYLSMFYLNNLMNTDDYEHPTAKYRDLYTTIINPSSYKETRIDIGYVEVTTDKGILTEENAMVNSLGINNVQELVDLNAHSDGIFAYLVLQSSGIETFYTRSYKKIQTVLAEVGGLSNTFLMLLVLIISPYLTLKSREALMRDVFDLGENLKQNYGHNVKDSSNSRKKQKRNKTDKHKTNSSNRGSVTKYTTTEAPVLKELLSPATLVSESQPVWGDTPRKLLDFNHLINRNFSPQDSVQSNLVSPRQEGQNQRPQTMRTEGFDTDRKLIQEKPQDVSEVQEAQEPDPIPKNNFALKHPAYTRTFSPTSFTKSPFSRAKQGDEQFQIQLSDITSKGEKSPIRKLITENTKLGAMKGDKHEENDFDLSFDSEDSEITVERHLDDLKVVVDANVRIEEATNKESQQEKSVKAQSEFSPENKEQKNAEEDNKEIQIEIEAEENKKEYQQEELQSDPKNLQNQRKRLKHDKKIDELEMWEYVLSFVWQPKPLKRKLQLINEGVNNINQRLDLSNILKKFCEIDKLITLLLDGDQLELFNNMPKPRLKRPNVPDLMKQTTFEESLQKKISMVNSLKDTNKLKKSLNAISLRENKSKIDKRLLAIFEKESI